MLPATAIAATPIKGRWITNDGGAVVAIADCGNKICGRIERFLKPPVGPQVDAKNPDATLRTRPLLGLPLLTDLAADGDGWTGRIYDPRSGRTYRAVVTTAADGKLRVKGCLSILCQTVVWTPTR
ncbi:DUF2147 domain-containing protein [uncultured Sphingomonas sp.]|uniref:DUF2147 domain-containing protein n=1 Tax=uncultured Sphingomonas sp. TaxID=158754 RepID=UPI0035CC02AA